MDAYAQKYSVSTIPLCNMTLGLLIIAQIPIMFGMVSGPGTIGIIPWVLCAYPVIILCVIMMFRNGDFMDASINGILSAVLMGQNAVSGMIYLAYSATGAAVPAEVAAGMGLISGLAFLVGGIILLCASVVAFRMNKVTGLFICLAGIGFVALFAMYYGAGQTFGFVGGSCLVALAVYLLATGVIAFFPKKEAA